MGVDIEDSRHHAAGQRVFLGEIDQTGNGLGEAAVAVHFGQLARHEIRLARFRFGRTIAQHQMGEIEIERMRRHIRALRHEAHVAERAGFNDLGKIFRLYGFHFAFGCRVDEIEEAREGIAEIEAAPAAMADVEHAPHLGVDFFGIGEVGIAPIDFVARGRFKAAFAGHVAKIQIEK